MNFVLVTIPDGIREMSAAENAEASPVAEDAAHSGTVSTTYTAECREDQVQRSASQEKAESGREETAEENSCVNVQQQQVALSSEVGGSQSDDYENSETFDDVASSHLITNGEMKPLIQDAAEKKAIKDDRQPTAVEDETEGNDSHAASANEADICHEDSASALASNETNTNVTAEEEEFHGKHLLDSNTDDHNEKTNGYEVEQKQSVTEDELNSREQLMQQTAKHTDEASGDETNDNSRAENNDSALDESTNRDVETAENTTEESGLENKFSECDSRFTTEAVENDKESVRNGETEQLSESVSEETSEHLQSMEKTWPQAETQIERNEQTTPESQTKDHESVQQRTANRKPELMSDHENEHTEQHLMHSGTVEQHATGETGETSAETDACDRSTFESDKSADPAAESAEQQTSEPGETSTRKDEGRLVDFVQPADSQPHETSESAEQGEKVSMQQTNCKQGVQDHVTNTGETGDKQSGTVNSDDIKTERQDEVATNADQNELEVADVKDKTISPSENNESESTEEAENAQTQVYAIDKEENAVEMSTADAANVKEGSKRPADKLAVDYDIDGSVEATNRNHPVDTDEVHNNGAISTAGQYDENVPHDSYDEPDKTTGQSRKTSEATQDEPPAADKVCAQEDSCNIEDIQKEGAEDDEDVKEQAGENDETSDTMPDQENAGPTEVQKEIASSDAELQQQTEILEETITDEIVDNAEIKNLAENDVEQNEQLQSEQTEPTAETESQPAVMTANELAIDISEEEFSAGGEQPYENCFITEEVENQSESANAVHKSSTVSNEMCENMDKAIEVSETTEPLENQLGEMAVESQAELRTCVTERAAEQLETEVVEDKSHSDEEATENRERNGENISDVESPSGHHEIEFLKVTESEEQPDDVSETAEDNLSASAVEPCDRNGFVEVKDEHNVETETETERRTETIAATEYSSSESAKQFDENCASDTQEVQSNEISEATNCSTHAIEADARKENKSLMADSVEVNEEQSMNVTDYEHITHDASNSITSDTGTDRVAGQTETTQSAEVTTTCNITSTSDEVFEATESDKVSQHNVIVYGHSEEISNRQPEDDQEPTQLFNGHDTHGNLSDSAEKHESIRSYVDGCRDIELSGMKLGSDQVGYKVVHYNYYCFLLRFNLMQRTHVD